MVREDFKCRPRLHVYICLHRRLEMRLVKAYHPKWHIKLIITIIQYNYIRELYGQDTALVGGSGSQGGRAWGGFPLWRSFSNSSAGV